MLLLMPIDQDLAAVWTKAIGFSVVRGSKGAVQKAWTAHLCAALPGHLLAAISAEVVQLSEDFAAKLAAFAAGWLQIQMWRCSVVTCPLLLVSAGLRDSKIQDERQVLEQSVGSSETCRLVEQKTSYAVCKAAAK